MKVKEIRELSNEEINTKLKEKNRLLLKNNTKTLKGFRIIIKDYSSSTKYPLVE